MHDLIRACISYSLAFSDEFPLEIKLVCFKKYVNFSYYPYLVST